jgi:hypothetical protein
MEELGFDCFLNIATYLDIPDLYSLSLSSTRLYSLLSQISEFIWRERSFEMGDISGNKEDNWKQIYCAQIPKKKKEFLFRINVAGHFFLQ